MADNFNFDAYSPAQIAQRVNDLGVAKTRIPLLSQAMLGMLAGAFIGLGALYFVIVQSDASLGFAAKRVAGGMVFSLGLLLVVVAGAELFTGNNLLAMAWADRKVSTAEVLRNWIIICLSNFAGAVGLALIVFLSGHPAMNGGAVRDTYIAIATAKTSQPMLSLFFSGILCNVLVCMAVWMTLAGRSVVDKLAAVLLPISAFVAAGFEHSVANMYLIPMGMLLKAAAGSTLPLSGLLHNLVPVIAGNLVGGSVMVALVYYVIYVRPKRAAAPPKSTEEVRHAG
jgi:formate/nitrite transporter